MKLNSENTIIINVLKYNNRNISLSQKKGGNVASLIEITRKLLYIFQLSYILVILIQF
jgi:hypothetical protein